VDVDLLSEAPGDTKISRKQVFVFVLQSHYFQAFIKLKSNGFFYIKNIGKAGVFVNGKPVETGKKKRLTDCCLVEVGRISGTVTSIRSTKPDSYSKSTRLT
jgi:hypothetical protein